MSDSTRLKSTLYVGGLDSAVTSTALQAAFVPFGEVVDVSLPQPDLASSREPHRGFGYVEFEFASDAKEAIDNMDQSEFYGRIIKVALAKPQKDQNEGLGSRTAVWEQEGWLAKHAVDKEELFTAGANTNEEQDAMQGLESFDVAGPKAQQLHEENR